jgi:predicted TIM-barrel fold metal-dependent hydrolase
MCVKPEYSVEYIEEQLTTKPFCGIKPYPDMISGKKGAEIGIFEFLPPEQMALAERLGKVVVLHLPRAGRMPDDNNIRELREIRQQYPSLHISIAHMGRCFTPFHFELAIKKLGEDAAGFWFDTAAVLNPEVHKASLSLLDHRQILFGTDEPIFLWHGRRAWTKTTYRNLAREDFAWNTHEEGKDKESQYTFYVYEQINNILTAIENAGLGEEGKKAIFHDNASKFFSSGKTDNT